MYVYWGNMQISFVNHRFSYFYEINIIFMSGMKWQKKILQSLFRLLNLHNIEHSLTVS